MQWINYIKTFYTGYFDPGRNRWIEPSFHPKFWCVIGSIIAATHQLRGRGVEQRVEQGRAPDSKPVEVDQAVQKAGGHIYAGVRGQVNFFLM